MKISLKTGCETPKTVLAECTLKKKKWKTKNVSCFSLSYLFWGEKKQLIEKRDTQA